MAANTITVYTRALQASKRAWAPSVLALALTGAATLSACGSGTSNTASVVHSAQAHTGSQATDTTAHTTPSTVGTPKSAPRRAEQMPTATSRRSAPAPAFTGQPGSSEGLGGALRVLGAYGFSASDTSTYQADHTLRVLIGRRTGSSAGYAQQAFFFEGEHYLGTDASDSSAAVKVVSEGDTEVTLAYALYRPHDSLCCPSGGQATVRFQLNDGRLQALDPIPPASSATAASRNLPAG